MNYQTPARREALAAAYVVGTLRGGARRRMKQLLINDVDLQSAVADWENRLQALINLVEPANPPARIWRNIAEQVAAIETSVPVMPVNRSLPVRTSSAFFKFRFFSALRLWQATSLSLACLVLALFVSLQALLNPVSTPKTLQGGTYVALLQDDQARTVLLVSGAVDKQQVTFQPLSTAKAIRADQDLELWALSAAGAARSLGIISHDKAERTLPNDVKTSNATAFAVSLEPKGGSPTGAPTGPVLYSGKIMLL